MNEIVSEVATEISAQVADWSREKKKPFEWDPGRSLLSTIRDYQRASARRDPVSLIAKKLAALRYRFWSIVSGADIPVKCRIGGGLIIPHPNGIVIHEDVEIGPNCLIFQQVTLGANFLGTPTIGGHVDIGAGAKILGPIHVGDHAIIGANAVVLADVPIGATAVGIPARALASKD